MTTEVAVYPRREKFFSHRFIRLIARVCLANELGPEVCWLLAIVANTEDVAGYKRAVTFFNLQLASLVGVGSASSLERFRKKAIAAGWLHYEPGRRHMAGKYWVMIPPGYETVKDGAFDHNPDDYQNRFPTAGDKDKGEQHDQEVASYLRTGGKQPVGNGELPRHRREETAQESARIGVPETSQDGVISSPAVSNREESDQATGKQPVGECSTIFPSPFPNTEDPPNPPEAGGEDKTPARRQRAPRTTARRPRDRDLLFEAVAEVTGLDAGSARSKLNSACKKLREADVAFTPDEVREFGNRFWEFCPYAAQQGRQFHERPYPHELATYIGLLRAGPAPQQRRPQFVGNRAATETDIAERSLLASIPVGAVVEGAPE
ncbi:MAG TPA: hypothetical protein VHR66_33125 [Gemmataceae bacterium]|jgi:hypothetical protein|nr:hypothetical protein [Gemmataceae bacterium]